MTAPSERRHRRTGLGSHAFFLHANVAIVILPAITTSETANVTKHVVSKRALRDLSATPQIVPSYRNALLIPLFFGLPTDQQLAVVSKLLQSAVTGASRGYCSVFSGFACRFHMFVHFTWELAMHAMMYRFSSVVGPKITRPSQLAARYQFFLDVVTGILGESNAVFHEPARDPVSSLWQLFGSPDPIRRSDLNIWLMSWAASFASRVGSLPVDKTRQGPEWPVMMRFQGEHSLQLASEGEFPRFWLKLGEPDAFASDVEGRRAVFGSNSLVRTVCRCMVFKPHARPLGQTRMI